MTLFRFTHYRWASEHPRHGIPLVSTLEAEGWVRIANSRRWTDSWLMGKT
jgi:hypothetical protein